MTDHQSPPNYALNDQLSAQSRLQILISPSAGSTAFQNGHLGADNDHSSIEGEVQIKDGTQTIWDKM